MKLTSLREGSSSRACVVIEDEIVDLMAVDPKLPRDLVSLLSAGAPALERAARAVESGNSRVPLASVQLAAPLTRPPKILAVGLNYRDHAEEAGIQRPDVPMIFNKQSTAVTGPYDPIHRPQISDKLDYEGELGVVIGRTCRHVPRDRAHEVIAGYTVVNDVSVRDWQMRVPTFTMGKSFDTHCPHGPWIATPEEVGDPHSLELRTWVNGELRQHSNTKHLMFDCFTLVEHLSSAFTLEPGDLISTGTPAGVGSRMKPRQYLKAGDVVRIAIEGIGEIENTVVEEPQNLARI